MVRQFFRELFARESAEEETPPVQDHPAPSIYDTLIESLEEEVRAGERRLADSEAAWRSYIADEEKRLSDRRAVLQHKREQLAVLRTHRDEELREALWPSTLQTNAGGWNGVAFIDAHGREYSAAEFDRAVACGAIAIDR